MTAAYSRFLRLAGRVEGIKHLFLRTKCEDRHVSVLYVPFIALESTSRLIVSTCEDKNRFFLPPPPPPFLLLLFTEPVMNVQMGALVFTADIYTPVFRVAAPVCVIFGQFLFSSLYKPSIYPSVNQYFILCLFTSR